MSNAMMTAVTGNELTMSSREIAEVVEVRHDSVKRTVERLVERGVITLPPMEETSFTDSLGRKQWTTHHLIGKRDSYVIIAQLSPEFTARLVDRWQELEKQVDRPQVPQSFAEALRLAADTHERLEMSS
ncbi:Rha family transcriptional regulator [Halomonas sp. M4R5S39]|uniref:Rha family transcriptional regulator n=1 Tax=Halomonas kalidii TaxID=3043293 RepID=UPI0024A9B175|nr:Rha family transcriptional regulator [Halomonas kalidii]MDI5985305.1 Rha family transcriptional regulator [Halomonas kalidii]